jgi:hypothetical protein
MFSNEFRSEAMFDFDSEINLSYVFRFVRYPICPCMESVLAQCRELTVGEVLNRHVNNKDSRDADPAKFGFRWMLDLVFKGGGQSLKVFTAID